MQRGFSRVGVASDCIQIAESSIPSWGFALLDFRNVPTAATDVEPRSQCRPRRAVRVRMRGLVVSSIHFHSDATFSARRPDERV